MYNVQQMSDLRLERFIKQLRNQLIEDGEDNPYSAETREELDNATTEKARRDEPGYAPSKPAYTDWGAYMD